MTHKNSLNNSQFVPLSVPLRKAKKKRNEVSFTDTVIKNLKPSDKRIDYWCVGLNGFGLRVSETGTKSWLYVFRVNGKRDKLFLGQYPQVSLREARQAYFDAFEKVERGINPAEEKRQEKKLFQNSLTVNQLVQHYEKHCIATGKKSWKDEKQTFEKDLLPTIGHIKICDVNKDENVQRLRDMFASIMYDRQALSTADHLFSYTRRLFNYSADKGLMRYKENPCHEIKLGIERKKRQRHLDFKEIYQFWHGLEDVRTTETIKLGLKMMLCTVSRGIEVREMKWRDLSDKETIWILPTSKNKKMHRVYLGDVSKDLIKQVKPLTGLCPYVFASTHRGRSPIKDQTQLKPISNGAYAKMIRRNFSVFDISEGFTPHDLRRTAATVVASMLGKKDLLKKLLNHTDQDVTDIYDQYLYEDEKELGQRVLNHVIERITSSPSIEDIPTQKELKEEIRSKFLESENQPLGKQRILTPPLSYSFSYSLTA